MVGATVVHAATKRLDAVLGGAARRQVVIALGAVLALDSADKSTVGACATQLQSGLGIGKVQIGLLLAVSSLASALATLPFGMLVDRRHRTRMLSTAVACWGVAMAWSGFASGFALLLVARIALGVVAAVAGPAIASLLGDFFPARDRGRIYGLVLAGELVGAGFGFLVAGQFASLSWRAPFFVLVVPTVLVWWLTHRLPEPARGGPSRLPSGATDVRGDDAIASGRAEPYRTEELSDDGASRGRAHRLAERRGVAPREEAVLADDPDRMSLRQAVRYVLAVRTNVVLIVASALGYFFFSGLRGFAVEFAKSHFGVGQGLATTLTLVLGVGALLGVLLGGRLADRMLDHGRMAGRIEVAGIAVLAAAILFVPALVTSSLALAVPLLMLAALCLGAANPALDAARLDIIDARLWGRAEAVRSVLRTCGDAAAPLLFGILAESVFTGRSALEDTFLVSLTCLFAAAAVMLTLARRTYPGDVAAAAQS